MQMMTFQFSMKDIDEDYGDQDGGGAGVSSGGGVGRGVGARVTGDGCAGPLECRAARPGSAALSFKVPRRRFVCSLERAIYKFERR